MKRVHARICVALAAACLAAVGAGPAWASVDQSMDYQADAAHDGVLRAPAFSGSLAQVWSHSLPGAMSYPVAADGLVYVTAADGPSGTTAYGTTLYALDAATGAIVWSHALGGTYFWSDLAYDAGRVYAVNFDGLLSAFDATTGAVDWSAQLPGQYAFSSAPTATDGVVYDDGAGEGATVYANDERTGALLWSSQADGGDDSSPAIDGNDLFVTFPDTYYALNLLTGLPDWVTALGGDGGGGRTAVVAAGHVYVRDWAASALILSESDGSTQGPLGSTTAPAVGGGTAYEMVGGTLEAASDNGLASVKWTFTGDGGLDTAPLIVGDTVYVGSSLGNLYALDPTTGDVRWSGSAGQAIPGPDEQNVSQPLTGLGAGGGTVFVPAGDDLVAFAAPGAAAPPVDQVAPSVEGVVRSGDQVAADVGAWTNLPGAYKYNWQRCDAAGSSCASIAGATASIYLPLDADIGSTLRVAVTATNSSGDGQAVVSAPTDAVLASLAANLSVPGISGTTEVGATLSASPGAWLGSPTGYTYQWERCSGPCTPIAGATSQTYVPGSADQGYGLEVAVIALSAGGASPAAHSSQTSPIEGSASGPVPPPGAPINGLLPAIDGTPQVGGGLSLYLGSWTNPVDFFTVQWLRCFGAPAVCSPIDTAGTGAYTPVAGDLGATLLVEVTATNSSGSSQVYTNAVGPVAAAPDSGATSGSAGATSGSGGAAGSPSQSVGSLAASESAPPVSGSAQAATKQAAGGSSVPVPAVVGSAELGTASVSTPHGVSALRRTGLAARVRCLASCRVSVMVTLARTDRSHSVTVVGQVKHALIGGKTTPLRILVTPSGSRALAGRKTVTLTVDVTFTGSGARTSTIVRTLRV